MRASAIALAVLLATGCKFPELPPLDETDAGDGDAGGPDADLTTPQRLTVSVLGEGVVMSSPTGIDCGTACAADFDPLSTVSLTPTAAASSVFEEWSGACTGPGACAITMDGAKSASARFALHGAVRWVHHVSRSGDDYAADVVVDPSGNAVVASTIDDGGGFDILVSKLSGVDGLSVWTQHFDTPDPGGSEQVEALTVDSSGNVYVAVSLQGNGNAVTYGTHAVVGDPFFNIVVMRLASANGAVDWVKQWGGPSTDRPTALALSGNDLYVVGKTSSNPSTFDGRSIAGQSGNGFVVRVNAQTGAVAELKLIPGTVDMNSVAVNGTNLVVGGAVRTATTVETGCAFSPSGAGSDAMLLALSGSTLSCQWARNFGDTISNNDAHVISIATFAAGGWAVAGHFEGGLAGLTATSLGSRGDFDIFAARFAVDGTHQGSFRYGDVAGEFAGAIATTPPGNVILSGSFSGSIVLGSFTVTGVSNAFVTRMSSVAVPTHEWAVSLGGNEFDSARSVVAAPDGSVYVLSDFSGMTTVGATPLSAQAQDAWLAALVR